MDKGGLYINNRKFILEEITGQRQLSSATQMVNVDREIELFVKNVPSDALEIELTQFFEKVGTVSKLRLMMNEGTSQNRGFMYVTFSSETETEAAMKILNLIEFRPGHFLSVELSLNNCRIFIGGIPVWKTKDQVWHELLSKGVCYIVDVIMYRSYNNRAENRGFVFVEFPSHKQAAKMRSRHKDLELWDNKVIVDWSVPIPETPKIVMAQVKIIYLRNLDIIQSRDELKVIAESFISSNKIEKIYKFKNYAFIHISNRADAEILMNCLKEYYKDSFIEVAWAKPPNQYTQPEFRKSKITRVLNIPGVKGKSHPQEIRSEPTPSNPYCSHRCGQMTYPPDSNFDESQFRNMTLNPSPSTDYSQISSSHCHSYKSTAHMLGTRSSLSPILPRSPQMTLPRIHQSASVSPRSPNLHSFSPLQPHGMGLQPSTSCLAERYPRGLPSIQNLRAIRKENKEGSYFQGGDLTSLCPQNVINNYIGVFEDLYNN